MLNNTELYNLFHILSHMIHIIFPTIPDRSQWQNILVYTVWGKKSLLPWVANFWPLRFKLLTEGCKLLTEILIPSGK